MTKTGTVKKRKKEPSPRQLDFIHLYIKSSFLYIQFQFLAPYPSGLACPLFFSISLYPNCCLFPNHTITGLQPTEYEEIAVIEQFSHVQSHREASRVQKKWGHTLVSPTLLRPRPTKTFTDAGFTYSDRPSRWRQCGLPDWHRPGR